MPAASRKWTPNCNCPRRDADKHRQPCPYASRPVPRQVAGQVAVSPGVYADWLIDAGLADRVDDWAACRPA